MTDNPEQPAANLPDGFDALSARFGSESAKLLLKVIRAVVRNMAVFEIDNNIEELVRAAVKEALGADSIQLIRDEFCEIVKDQQKQVEELRVMIDFNPLHDGAATETCVNEFQPSGELPSKGKQAEWCCDAARTFQATITNTSDRTAKVPYPRYCCFCGKERPR